VAKRIRSLQSFARIKTSEDILFDLTLEFGRLALGDRIRGMMLFGERDKRLLEGFFNTPAQGTLVVRQGGFSRNEEELLADIFLDKQKGNLYLLSLEDGKKGVGIEQVRKLAAALSTLSRSGERRLVIVSDRHAFGVQAQNTFLKILEEPPVGVYFLLLASGPDSFLPTISSRSQIIRLNGPNEEEVLEYLIKEAGLNEPEAKMLYLQAGGNPAEILRLVSDDFARKKSLEELSLAKKFLIQNSYDRLVLLKNYQNAGKRDEAVSFLKSLLVVLELASKKDAKEALRWSSLAEKVEKSLVNINLNANSKVELLSLV